MHKANPAGNPYVSWDIGRWSDWQVSVDTRPSMWARPLARNFAGDPHQTSAVARQPAEPPLDELHVTQRKPGFRTIAASDRRIRRPRSYRLLTPLGHASWRCVSRSGDRGGDAATERNNENETDDFVDHC
jgi:hypothetical protein